MKKRAIALTMALLLCLSCALPASASGGSRFTDVPDNAWYAEAVNAMADGGVLNGKGNGRFDPDAPVTLAELSVIYCRLWGYEVKADYGHWAGSALHETMLGVEMILDEATGYWNLENGDCSEFPYADSSAYRADALSLLGTVAYEKGINASVWNEIGYPVYSFDFSNISDRDEYRSVCKPAGTMSYCYRQGHLFTSEGIDMAYMTGLTHGMDSKYTCNAFGTLTRAQLAQMCYNMGWTTAGCWKDW